MIVRKISRPARGERVVAVCPGMAPTVDAGWRRRLRLFTGRTLSDTAMITEQTVRAGRLATHGQNVSPGVVQGLEVSLERVAVRQVPPGPRERPILEHFIHVAPGFAIAAAGEDVLVDTGLRVDCRDLPVHAPAEVLDPFREGEEDEPPTAGEGEGDEEEAPEEGALRVRYLGPTLGELLEAAEGAETELSLPRAGILVLQPAVARVVGEELRDPCEYDPRKDPCEQDPESYAFDDHQEVDACRLVLYTWPDEWLPMPAAGPRWRNRLAYAIFSREAQSAPDLPLPWELVGVPIGLIAFDEGWYPLFVDRYSVVRAGGKPKRRTPLAASPEEPFLTGLSEAGSPFLWQARMQQFAEQIGERLGELDLAGDDSDSGSNADGLAGLLRPASDNFRFLPPVGVLPRAAVQLLPEENGDGQVARQTFFPSSYRVDAVPVPVEQLDVAARESAPLAPFDLFTPDRVQILVPVPQIWYEPRLLLTETVDLEFQETIDRFVARRAELLLRRADVREKASALIKAITGEPAEYPDPDPEALEEEELAEGPLDPPEKDYGTSLKNGTRVVDLIDSLRADLRNETPIRHETTVSVPPLPPGLVFPENLRARIRYLSRRLTFEGMMTAAERGQLIEFLRQALDLPEAGEETKRLKKAIRKLYRQSQKDELSRLDRLGLRKFIDFLEEKVRRANDKIDFGFVRVQTDIYRVRQLVLGVDAASKLAVSPALATIARGETAFAAREDIKVFAEALRAGIQEVPPDSGDPGDVSGGGPDDNPGDNSDDNPRSSSAGPGRSGERFMSGEFTRLRSTGFTVPPEVALEKARHRESEVKETDLFGPRAATREDIFEQEPIVGKTIDYRNVTVAERLQEPPAPEAKSYSVATKYDVLTGLMELDIAIDDLAIPGFFEYEDEELKTDEAGRPITTSYAIGVIRDRDLAEEILEDQHDLDPTDRRDEAAFFGAGVRALENAVATLRLFEGRVESYRRAIEMCRRTLKRLRALAAEVDRRLKEIGDELAEARHDVAVARALLAEEEARLNEINERRRQIIAEHVDLLVFRRPRLTQVRVTTPERRLDPGLVEPPVPVCMATAPARVPTELRAMVELVREAPVSWFTHVPAHLNWLDRLDVLHGTLLAAKGRAKAKNGAVVIAEQVARVSTSVGQAILKAFTAQQQVVATYRSATAMIDLSQFTGQSWQRSRDRAADVLSLGDLIDAPHGRTFVTQQAARELESIFRVSACLYEGFGEVLPSIRLDWTERLSQHDAPANLRNLYSLPRFGEIDFLDRKELQGLVDWLFSRIDPRQPDAVAMMNDLVRVCLLLASHAPVNEIIAGHVPEATTVKVGGTIRLAVDLAKVRVGMSVLMFAAKRVVARGIVEDLYADGVSARVVQAEEETVALEKGARVQFGERTGFELNPQTAGIALLHGGQVIESTFQLPG